MVHKRRELGSASMFVSLDDGVITVTHGTDNIVLVKRPAYEGDWDKIWKTLRKHEV